MYQENEMLLPVKAVFCAKWKTSALTVALINDSVFMCMLRKKGCFDENALAGLCTALGKSVEDNTNLPLAPCDWLKFATGCGSFTHSRKETAVFFDMIFQHWEAEATCLYRQYVVITVVSKSLGGVD